MRIAELVETGRFRLIDGPVPEPGPGEVQVRVHSVGVCGSDLHYFVEGGIGDIPCAFPMVLGHEPAGVVVKTGPGVSGWSPGDRAALEPAIYCYHCEYCLSGRHNVCANVRFLSMPGEAGYFRDFITIPATNLLPLPTGLGFAEGTVFEPLAVILHSMRFIAPESGQTVAVFGAGPMGLLTIAVLKLHGARVWAVEPVAHRRRLAEALGADAVVDPDAGDPVAEILSDTKGRGVDVAVDCAARGGSMNHCVNAARNGGRLVITGIPAETYVPLEFHPIRRKELAIYNVRRSNHDSEMALDLLREQPARFAPMLTHTLPLEKVQKAFTMLEHYSDGVGKVVIQLA